MGEGTLRALDGWHQDALNPRAGLREETVQAQINLGISSKRVHITNNFEVFIFIIIFLIRPVYNSFSLE